MWYRLNRLSRLHNILRATLNAFLFRIPFGVKYGVGGLLRRARLPYRLLEPGDIVIQVGAPWDLLEAGRSRAVHFAQRVGESGRVFVVEPDPTNTHRLKLACEKHEMRNIKILEYGLWSEPGKLKFLTNPKHPATNLVESVYVSERQDRDEFRTIEIDVKTLDDVVEKEGIANVTLLSITTNGAEHEILKGLTKKSSEIRAISIINAGRCSKELQAIGFNYVGEDDRGQTWENTFCND